MKMSSQAFDELLAGFGTDTGRVGRRIQRGGGGVARSQVKMIAHQTLIVR
jgi:hypothetical protein